MRPNHNNLLPPEALYVNDNFIFLGLIREFYPEWSCLHGVVAEKIRGLLLVVVQDVCNRSNDVAHILICHAGKQGKRDNAL